MIDAKKIAAEAKAKALADLKTAELMVAAAEQIEIMAKAVGWKVTISVDDGEQKPAPSISETLAAKPFRILPNPAEKKKRGGKLPAPNSVSSRAKAEAPKVVRELLRPVPLGEMAKILDQRGIKFGGKEPNQALSAILGTVPELASTKRGWWLSDVPLPPVDNSAIVQQYMPWEKN